MDTIAVILEQPEQLRVGSLALTAPGDGDVVVDVALSGISTGTERLLWTGRMPAFPGMGYPLVPGYESVGRVREPARDGTLAEGDLVFVPGARCFGEVRGLFGGSASRLVVAESRILRIDDTLARSGVLLALAATAYHALVTKGTGEADLIVGHGVLGRLLARLSLAVRGRAPVVWERDPARAGGAAGYAVVDPETDERTDYGTIYDVSGDAGLLDRLIGRLRPGGEVVLAGFYHEPVSFAFPPAFMREARLRVAAQWQPDDLVAVRDLIETGQLSLEGLVTHEASAADAPDAYRTAFGDPTCLKMTLNWSTLQ